MTMAHLTEPTPRKPLRLWPGVVIVILQWLVRFVLPAISRDAMIYGLIGGMVGGLAVVVWWLFFSRAPWSERLGALALIAVALFATSRLVHESIQNGMMGMMLVISAIPFLSLALVAGAAASRQLSIVARRVAMAAAILLACGGWTLVRTGGISGYGGSDLHWRWTPTPEERLLTEDHIEPKPLAPPPATAGTPVEQPRSAKVEDAPVPPPAVPAATKTEPAAPAAVTTEPAATVVAEPRARWPGFRGPSRDGIISGVRIETDWAKSPPVQLWRRPIGPGWSSFAVRGDVLYTQEQRGDDEVVAAYKVSTGDPVWRHRDAVRFWESNGGAGPRATPTLSGGRVYTFGATGILNVLDAGTGSVVWSRNTAADTGKKVPEWGFSSSPLVVDDVVIVHAGVLVAYDLATGKRRWIGPPGRGGSYSSPHLVTIGGVAQVLMLSGASATSVAPADGTLLWENARPGEVPIVQPAVTADGDILITATATGTRRLHVAHGSSGWTVEERWTSSGLKPYFNDYVVHKGHAFGFDGSILVCIDLEDGKRTWKGGRYGNGQLVLLPEQDVLLVLSEEGDLALVRATPDQFTEVAKFAAVLDGKTWNHPVVVGDVLLVRNGQEMAAFRLTLEGS